MGLFLRHLSLILFLIAITMPFNNCSPTNSTVASQDSSVTNTATMMSISVSGSTNITVPPNLQVFNLVGVCAVGSYPASGIDWQMTSKQGTWNSASAAVATGVPISTYLSSCVNGSFSITIRVFCPGAVNYTNGTCTGLQTTWTLVVRMYGESADGTQSANALVTSSPITLMP